METQTSWNPFKRGANRTEEVLNVDETKESIRALVEANVLAIVDDRESASVTIVNGEQTTLFEVKVSKSDIGKVIGKQGKTAQALRTILSCVSSKAKIRCILEIVE